MREIKFSAIYKPTGEKFEPSNIHPISRIVVGEFDNQVVNWCHFSNDGSYGDAIIREYTGLKDKNGKEIYEGDVVQIKGHPFEGHIKIDGNYEVYYNEVMELCCGNFLLHRELPYVMVIGNKFENPELLNN